MSVLSTCLNQLVTTLGAPHVASSGTLTLAAGYGAAILAEIAAEGMPAISPSNPVRVSVIAAAHAANSPILSAFRTIFACTSLTGDVLGGCMAIEGTIDRSYATGDAVRFNATAGSVNDLNTAVGALQSGSGNIDGGAPASVYGSTTPINGGMP